ncbi:MAG: twin-arginine translocation pathway signal [Planctomycetaceae bacterium]|nr:twin-arginine translocation pathway signal [Planctomycetaceae bacterium]
MLSEYSRREVLAAFLGIPAALSGCGTATPPKLPPGKLVGASASIGHRLRDGLKVEVPDDKWESTRVVIVGGGIAGLSAARQLRKSGIDDFVILELEPRIGGTSASGSSDVVAYPWGAHYVPAPSADNVDLIEFLEELNVFEGRDDDGDPIVAEQHLCRDPQERIFYKGTWYEGLYLAAGASPEDLDQFQQFKAEIKKWVGWRDSQGRRAFALPMAAGSDDADITALDKLTMADWLKQHGWNSERLKWYVEYACRDDYGLTLDQTSAWAGLFYFVSRMSQPGKEPRPFITWPEGNGRLVKHLYDPVEQQTRIGWAVADINPVTRDDREAVDLMAVSADGNTTIGFRAEHVIFAAPQFLTRYLIRPYRKDPPKHVTDFQYSAWCVANLELTERPENRGFPLCWDNVLYESPSLGYVTATHQKSMDYGPTVLTYYYPLCDADPRTARQRLLDQGRDVWAEIALSDLERAHPNIRENTSRIDVMRWGHAMIRPTPGFVYGGSRQQATQSFRNIHFAHSDLSGVALFEEAFNRGTRAGAAVAESIAEEPVA